MSRFAVHTKKPAPERSVKLLEQAKSAFGFVPNLLGVLAESPAVLNAYMNLGQFACGLLIILLFAATPYSIAAEPVIAPDWTLATADGETLRLSREARNQTTVLFFWATWCPYCKALMPHLQSIRLEHGDDIRILAINFREDDDPVQFIRDAGYDFTLLPDGDVIAETYGIHTTPGVIVIDGERAVHFDLRHLPPLTPPQTSTTPRNNAAKAAYLAPYWAAEIRKSIDSIAEGRQDTPR
jgi:thiol-disulfide isomerase/thioredoxin